MSKSIIIQSGGKEKKKKEEKHLKRPEKQSSNWLLALSLALPLQYRGAKNNPFNSRN